MSMLMQSIGWGLCVAGCVACGAFPRPPDLPVDGNVTSCTANEFLACEGNLARSCNATGEGTTTQDCGAAGCNADAKRCNQCVPSSDSCSTANTAAIDHCGSDGLSAGQDICSLGCLAAPTAHCAYLEPRYLPDICDSVAAMPEFLVANSARLDTNLDNNCNGGVVLQSGGPDICVVRYGSIHIMQTGTLAVGGPRALALVADSAVIVEGVLDVSGGAGGPGGSFVASGDKVTSLGGGGAGFATPGGAGGGTSLDGAGGLGGGKATDPSILTVLLGGTHPTRAFLGAPAEGAGGGAATLIACRGQVSVAGLIDAGGGGGQGGRAGNNINSVFGGAGGGSGGNVVLQGLSITVTGQVFANGGGGGAGFVRGGRNGLDGMNGTRSATEAAAGGVALAGEGAGGAGGRQGALPTFGLHPPDANATPGGGGGSMGFFQTYTPMGVVPTLTPIAASPVFGANKTIKTR